MSVPDIASCSNIKQLSLPIGMYTNTSAAAGLIIGSSYIHRTEYIGLMHTMYSMGLLGRIMCSSIISYTAIQYSQGNSASLRMPIPYSRHSNLSTYFT